MNDSPRSWQATAKAIVTDGHFWVPVVVLAVGLLLLAMFGASTSP